ncbi:LysM domain/BON superfamily protein [Novipirellula galeiformis]|uniref:LysM domain/BON superfamily protein n=1 Tax=Novipirellula galeiformis TaxID=2528004 RepID=A0A5C6CBW8_9BACT|nr:BON domain-containing protein [Novipirellula galeiformis]TWU21582.1 LysM domain/BON superfamily protein [Novipirellula galeiformis]
MRRTYFGLAIATIAALGPMQVFGGDREIAQQIIQRLKVNRDSGALKDFSLDMKVEQGVVLFRGNVSQSAQKDLVLMTASGIQGINDIVDEVTINGQTVSAETTTAKVVKPVKNVAIVATEPVIEAGAKDSKPAVAAKSNPKPASESNFSFSKALAAKAATIREATQREETVVQADLPRFEAPEQMPGEVRPTAAVELNASPLPSGDEQIVSSVVSALGQAQKSGQLRGFGVDVTSNGGIVQLKGRAASDAQRDAIVQIAESTPGVTGVRDAIEVAATLPRLPKPTVAQAAPVAPAAPMQTRMVANQGHAPAMAVPYRMNPQQQVHAAQVGYGAMQGAPTMGQPVPMAPYTGGGAPRYDSPNLPNYAWPGYAAHPNYAALTYPQQYSPSAWPYIGPFYPYPQVPLGWRKVSLEWDDGWWFLDFTDR